MADQCASCGAAGCPEAIGNAIDGINELGLSLQVELPCWARVEVEFHGCLTGVAPVLTPCETHCKATDLALTEIFCKRLTRSLLLVEVKGRAQTGLDRGGVGALDGRKRRRVSRAWSCWLVDHPDWQDCSVELVCALVPLPPLRGPVRWVRWG